MKKKNNKKHYVCSRPGNTAQALAGVAILLLLGGLLFFFFPTINEAPSTELPVLPKSLSEKTNQQKQEAQALEKPEIMNGKDAETGLLVAEGWQIVKASCTGCHSGKLIIQNRMTRKAWHEKIIWMQETQGLWDLGEHEAVILDYLGKNYGPQPRHGRRAPLENIEWYELENRSLP